MPGFENGYDPPNTPQRWRPSNTPTSVVLITGAGSGIGQGILLEFIKAGCITLIAADISPDGLDTAISRAKALNSNAETLKIIVDVTSQDAVDAMMAAAVERFGRIDYAVHCAGIACKFGRTDDTNPDEFEHVMSVNFKGLYLCERAALGQMKSQEPRVLEY